MGNNTVQPFKSMYVKSDMTDFVDEGLLFSFFFGVRPFNFQLKNFCTKLEQKEEKNRPYRKFFVFAMDSEKVHLYMMQTTLVH